MSLKRYSRIRNRAAGWMRVIPALAALLALVVARNVPPQFTRVASPQHSAISAIARHQQRPRFDSATSHWSGPVARFLPFAPTTESAHTAPAPQLSSTLQTKGFHYNRPPPTR